MLLCLNVVQFVLNFHLRSFVFLSIHTLDKVKRGFACNYFFPFHSFFKVLSAILTIKNDLK